MALIDWNNDLSLGIESIDAQNKSLVDLTNNLHLAMSVGRANDALEILLGDLTDYTENHLKYEEDLLSKYGYPNKETHIAQHSKLVSKVANIKQKIEQGERMLSMEVMLFLQKWIKEHIQEHDKAFAPFLIEKGVK